MKRELLERICLFLLLCPLVSHIHSEELNDTLGALVVENGMPGLAVMICTSRGTEYVFTSGKTQSGESIDKNTIFFLGSTSKTLTALAVVSLTEDDFLILDEPVVTYLPDFKVASSEEGPQITVRHLLNHTSGITAAGQRRVHPEKTGLAGEFERINTTVPPWAAGHKFKYDNGNYRLLGYLIENVTGQAFGDYLDGAILNPLGMVNTKTGPIDEYDHAPGHIQFLGHSFRWSEPYLENALPSGYISSSIGDIGLLLTEELRAARGESTVLPPDSIRMTWTAYDHRDTGYGMGWIGDRDSSGRSYLYHGGLLGSYQSFFFICPDEDVGFAILASQGGLLSSSRAFSPVREALLHAIGFDIGQGKTAGNRAIIIFAVLGIVFAIEAALCVRLFFRRRLYGMGITKKAKASIVLDMLISLFLAFGLIPLVNQLSGDRADWRMIFALSPELFFLLWMIILSGLFRGVFKAVTGIRTAKNTDSGVSV